MNSMYQIDKLNQNNFTIWKYRIEMVLKARKLWKYVEAEAGDDKAEIEKEQEALAQIALSVSDNVVGHIRGTKTAKAAWEKICSVFEQKGLATQIFLRRKLINLKFVDSEPMQNHINKIRELADQLDSIGDTVKDKELAIIVLCSLPERYDSLILSLEARSPSDLTFDFVAGRLLAEEERQKEQSINSNNNDNINPVAMFSSAGKDRNGKSVCHYCKKPGHFERNCWDKHGRSGRGKSNGEEVNSM